MTINEDSGSRKKRNISRGISRDVVTQRHPLNVKPSGNSLIFNDIKLTNQKNKLLGDFHIFNDELILDLLGFIEDPQDLKNLSHTSRLFYAFIYDEELWRRLYMRKALAETQERDFPLGIDKWEGSWRRTMLRIQKNQEANIQLPENLLCSDVLFRPYQCSQIDYKTLFKDLISEEEQSWKLRDTQNKRFGIERIDESKLTLELFNSEYYSKPFILTTTNSKRWPTWTISSLCSRFPNVKFRQESVQWPLSFYSQYFSENKDESPLYLFDCQSTAIRQLIQEYTPPEIFQTDFFNTFNTLRTPCRPDHRWLIAGPERSGSTFHKDPNFTSAWNANLCGMKLWVMLPPGTKPPGVGTDEEESEVTGPVGIAEWILSGFYNDSVKLATGEAGEKGKCQIGITFPGECMFVPSGWWHSVINLEDSVALTQNFVPVGYLPNVLNFLKNKKDQISGFHVKDFTKSLKEFLEEHKVEDRAIFDDYLQKIKDMEVNNEDIGELCSKVDLPIFEFFIELIKQNDKYQNVLKNALNELTKLENEDAKNLERKIVQSKIWDDLTKQNESSGGAFSFNFEESDED